MSASVGVDASRKPRGSPMKAKRKLPAESPPSPASSENSTVDNSTDDQLTVKKVKLDQDLILSKAEVGQLLINVQNTLPKHDTSALKATLEKLPWEAIKLPKHSADVCKQQWEVITKKIRKYRTMTEINEDAVNLSNSGKLMQMLHHADMPKKPLTPFFLFMQKTRRKIQAKNPTISFQDMSKIVTEKYRQLPPKKMKKYMERAAQLKAEYDLAMVKFREEHPDFKNDQQPKTTSPFALFYEERIAEMQDKEPEKSRRDFQLIIKEKWSALSTKKRMKYFNKAIEAKKKFDIDVAEYQKLYPDYKPPATHKGFLSKAEWKTKEEFDGKPQRPPVNALALYCMEKCSTMKDIEPKERMGEARTMWKNLTQQERDSYKLKASTKVQHYNQELEKYLLTLPEEERQKAREENIIAVRKTEKKKKPTQKVNSAKKLPAINHFLIQKMPEYKEKYPAMDDTAIARLLVKEFGTLSDTEKQKFQGVNHPIGAAKSTESHKKVNKVLFPGEPKKPMNSGYQLFCSEFMLKQKDLKSQDKMKEASKKWKSLSEKEKKNYTVQKDKLIAQYEKELAKFKKNLSPADRKRYEEFKTKTDNSVDDKKKSVKKESSDEESSEDSDESSSEEEDDDDDDDDDDDEDGEKKKKDDDSSSEESSSEESDSDTSESDSD